MSYSDNSICHRAILPVKAGFSKTYLIGSILEINQVVLLIMYWRRRFEAQAKAQHVFFEHGVTRLTVCEFLTQVIDGMLLLTGFILLSKHTTHGFFQHSKIHD